MTSSATSMRAGVARPSSLRLLDDAALGQQIGSALRARDPYEGTHLLDKYRIEVRAATERGLDRYDASRLADGRWVSVEMPTREAAAEPGVIERFWRIAEAECALRHKNLLVALDSGNTEDGRPFIVREAIDMEPLATWLGREHGLPWKRVRNIALQLCSAVAAARAHGLTPPVCVRCRGRCCVVCSGRRAVSTATGQLPCPHCVGGIPVVHLPARQESPRGTSA